MKQCKYITQDKQCLEADYFARNLLVPTDRLKDILQAMIYEKIPIQANFKLIGDYFAVSEHLIRLRLRDENMKEFNYLL